MDVFFFSFFLRSCVTFLKPGLIFLYSYLSNMLLACLSDLFSLMRGLKTVKPDPLGADVSSDPVQLVQRSVDHQDRLPSFKGGEDK